MSEHNIMVVDDDNSTLELLNVALQDAGYFVSTFEQAESALDSLDLCMPDLVISDLMMPKIDGIEFCKLFKSDEKTANIPFLFLTAFGEKKHMIACLEAGAVDFIHKPVNLNRLLPKISTLLNQVIRRETVFSILLVDSSPMLLKVTKRKLSAAGFLVTTTRKAEEAIELTHTRIYNLIISGVELSGMDGVDFCKLIKTSHIKDTPFVIFSGNVSEELIDKGIAAGVNDYWDKSISPEGLAAKVKAIARQNKFSIDFKGGMEGGLSEMNALELIQMIGMNRKTGILSLIGSSLEGHIHFNEGDVIDATTQMSVKERAFYNLITLGSEGVFHFIPTEKDSDVIITAELQGLQGLLMEGAKILDDINRIRNKAILLTDKEFNEKDIAEAQFLSLIDRERTFDTILKEAKVEPYEGFSQLMSLVEQGLVKRP